MVPPTALACAAPGPADDESLPLARALLCASVFFYASYGMELLRTSRSWKPPARYRPPLCPHCLFLDRDARSRQRRGEGCGPAP